MAALVGHGNPCPLSSDSSKLWTTFILGVLTLSTQVWGFNLDTTHTLHKLGDPGTFFGFSLALHQQRNPDPQSWILVGAPRAAGQGKLTGSRPGALFRCPITPEEYDCERVDIDGDVRWDRESKHNQWLGVTVKSQGIGGKVVTCAHLYELRQRVNQSSETRDPIGRCYVLSEDLTNRDDLDGGEWKFCEGRPQGHEQFGFCQQGLSVSFTPDKNFILFGAPGTYNWKGNMRVQLLNQTLLDLGIYDDGPYEVADEKQLNAQLIPVPYHSYLGFSVDSAMGIMSLGELTFVAGAPRANHTGAVVLLKKDNVYRLVPQHIFWGEELASSFGYSVATTDLNSDGWTDLIVGAPNFFDRKAEIGGAVYVYLNPFGHWDDQARPIRLNGTYDSMFGMTVSNVGDLDQDGYGDIAVGAPFDGDGKVFIYRGSKSGIETKPAQVLDGRDFDVRRFGYSISGGLDIDNNHYPDVAVGSLNDSVVLFRSRPVIHVKRDITIDPPQIDLEQSNLLFRCVCPDISVFQPICLPLCAPPFYSIQALVVRFEADTERRKVGLPHRVTFLGRSLLEPEYTQTEEVQLNRQRHAVCTNAVFQLHVSNLISWIVYSLQAYHKKSTIILRLLTQLISAQPSDYVEMPLFKNVLSFLPPLPSYRDEDDVQVFSLSDQRLVVLDITVTNMPSDPLYPEEDGDDAHAAQLIISLPNTLSYAGSRIPEQMRCQANQNGSQVECDLGNPVKRNSKLKFSISLSTANITIETTELTAELSLKTISEQPDLVPVTAYAKVVIELPLRVNPDKLFFSGAVRGESAMSSLDDIGSAVDFEFVVANPGQALQTLGSAFLNIMWPYELANEKWLLYPEEGQIMTKGSVGQTTPAVAASDRRKSLKLVRRTRSREPGKRPERGLLISCQSRCVLFQCPLHSFSGQAVLKIHARLWNSSFIEDFPAVSALELLVRANITVKSSIKHLVLKDAAVSVMIYPEHGVTDQYWIPWWIILIAILAGVLLLALLVLMLWKCGFFRRAHYKDKLPQYHAVKIPREDRPQFQTEKSGGVQKKEWATHWSDGTS
uniref:Integrin alpha-2 domain-containing protein n=1 Tax=Astatotilapia calliptera TaxID=8154 RepID=A0AAX7THQ7_ASTCA